MTEKQQHFCHYLRLNLCQIFSTIFLTVYVYIPGFIIMCVTFGEYFSTNGHPRWEQNALINFWNQIFEAHNLCTLCRLRNWWISYPQTKNYECFMYLANYTLSFALLIPEIVRHQFVCFGKSTEGRWLRLVFGDDAGDEDDLTPLDFTKPSAGETCRRFSILLTFLVNTRVCIQLTWCMHQILQKCSSNNVLLFIYLIFAIETYSLHNAHFIGRIRKPSSTVFTISYRIPLLYCSTTIFSSFPFHFHSVIWDVL